VNRVPLAGNQRAGGHTKKQVEQRGENLEKKPFKVGFSGDGWVGERKRIPVLVIKVGYRGEGKKKNQGSGCSSEGSKLGGGGVTGGGQSIGGENAGCGGDRGGGG